MIRLADETVLRGSSAMRRFASFPTRTAPPSRKPTTEAWTSSPHSLGITTGCPGGVTTLTHELLVPRSIPTAIASLIGCSPSALVRAILEGAWLGVNEGERSEEHTSELQSRENLVCRL